MASNWFLYNCVVLYENCVFHVSTKCSFLSRKQINYYAKSGFTPQSAIPAAAAYESVVSYTERRGSLVVVASVLIYLSARAKKSLKAGGHNVVV